MLGARRPRAEAPIAAAARPWALLLLTLAPAEALADGAATTIVLSAGEADAGTMAQSSSSGISLSALVDEAVERNLRVAIDAARIDEARALVRLATSQSYPRFSLNALFGGPTPEARTTILNDPSSLTPASREGDFDFGELGVTLRLSAEGVLPLYSFGKLSAAEDAARALERAAAHKRVITQAEVAMDVHRAFWAFQLTHSFIGSLEDGEKTLVKVLAKIEELLDNESPQVTENDRLRMLHALATVRVKLAEAKNAADLALKALRLLLGREQETPLMVRAADIEELPADIPDVAAMLAAARAERPEVLALGALVEAQDRWASFQRRRLLPDVFLGGVFRMARTTNATDQTNPFIYDPYNVLDVGVGLGLRMELDVFSKLAELEQAEGALETRTREARAVAQAVDLEVRKLHADLVNGYTRIQLLEKANRAARGWLTASTLAYDIGTGVAGELIDAFLAWAASEGELQKTRYDMHLAHADLARAAGRLVKSARGE